MAHPKFIVSSQKVESISIQRVNVQFLYFQVPEWIHEGLASAPEVFVNMMRGVKQDKVGKQMIQVS